MNSIFRFFRFFTGNVLILGGLAMLGISFIALIFGGGWGWFIGLFVGGIFVASLGRFIR